MVEWKKLGEVCEVSNGERPVSEILEEGLYPYINAGRTNSGFLSEFNSNGEAVTTPSHGEGGIGSVLYQNSKFWCGALCYRMYTYSGINSRYLFHYLSNNADAIISCKNIGGQPYINRKQLENIPIGVPSLEEQTRIVGILDTFTSAIDNLKEQIAQRRKQYEYYRDKLLDLEGKPEQDIHCWGEFCKMEKGNGVQKVDFVDEGIGCIHYGQIYTHYGPYTYETNKFVSEETFAKAKKASKGDVILTDTSENVEDICKSVAWLGDDDIAVSNHALIIKHNQNPKFLSYSTQTNSFFLQKRRVVVGVKVSGIKPDDLAKIKIFLPPLQVQQRIVSILDTFEASIQNLEAQLSQREKQYEYYRNKLLTFEKAE